MVIHWGLYTVIFPYNGILAVLKQKFIFFFKIRLIGRTNRLDTKKLRTLDEALWRYLKRYIETVQRKKTPILLSRDWTFWKHTKKCTMTLSKTVFETRWSKDAKMGILWLFETWSTTFGVEAYAWSALFKSANVLLYISYMYVINIKSVLKQCVCVSLSILYYTILTSQRTIGESTMSFNWYLSKYSKNN